MRSKSILLIMPLALAVLAAGCTSDSVSSYRERRMPSPYGAETDPTGTVVAQEAATPVPDITVDQEVVNCTDNPKCHLEEMQDTGTDPYMIDSLIVADSEALTVSNTNLAPALKFEVTGIDESAVSAVTYSYVKKDQLGNVLVQTSNSPIYKQSGSYTLPIHSSNLGAGILTSAPYEKHVFSLNITTSDNNVHSKNITFYLSSQMTNPLILERKTDIADSSYYKMNADDPEFTIDSVSVKNVLPFAITFNGDINVRNRTVAFLSSTGRVQYKDLMPAYNYNLYFDDFTRYHWYIGSTSANKAAVAAPIFAMKIHKGTNTIEEVPITIQSNNDDNILSFNGLVLQGNEEVQLDIVVRLNTNNSILGDHGSKTFYTGVSTCEVISEPKKCGCFYTPIVKTYGSSLAGEIGHGLCTSYMNALNGMDYPNCNNGLNTAFIESTLSMNDYPEENIALSGRHHSTNTSYTVTSWLKDYEYLDPLGTTTKTMDVLEASKGYVDYAAIDINQSYQGYIPGTLN
jgi:hypothetical protein